jgi:excisionase family DNA binding protein
MDRGSDVLTVDEIAERVHITREAVLLAIHRGELPAKKFGNRVGWRVRLADYEKWLATPTLPKQKETET